MKFVKTFPAATLVMIAALFAIFPILWILLMALKSPIDAFALPPKLVFSPVLENFTRAWSQGGFTKSFVNSVVICLGANILSMVAAVPAAYGLTRHEIRGRRTILVGLLMFYMLPEFLLIIPLYSVYQSIGLFDTRIGLIIAYQVFALPFAIWLLHGFFVEIPGAIAEAAELDGCSSTDIMLRIYVPLSTPGITAIVILNTIRMWNELTFALALTFSNAQTVTLSIASFRGYGHMDWGAMAASAMIATFPMIVLALFAQRYIVRGLTLGAVK